MWGYYILSLQTGLTTAPRSMLASLPVDWGVGIGSCVLLPALLAAHLNLAMSLDTCLMYAGYLLSSGFHIGLLPWSGAAYLALLLFTFVSSVVLSIVL